MNTRALTVLDPGHGGTVAAAGSSPNRGSGPNGLLEKDVALDLARRVRDRLLDEQTVVLTRDSDVNLSLAARADTARTLGAGTFVSLHLSSADPTDRTDTVVARDAHAGSRRLADALGRRVREVTGAAGEVLTADLGQIAVQRHAPSTAAALVEIASLAAPGRAVQLADPAYLDRLADAVAAAIRESGAASPPLATPQWVGARYARSTAIVTPDVDYSATSLAEAARLWLDWLSRYAQWTIGVPDLVLRTFPHAAICQLRLYDAGGRLAYGTGFYIGDEVLLTCGHNFLDDDGWTTTRVEVQPGHSPRTSLLPSASFTLDGSTVVHPRWRSSFDQAHDLAVLRVPGLPAQAGHFRLANMSLSQSAGIVVCGYGKVDGTPFEDQGQRLDGAHIADSDFDLVYYPIQTIGGHSGSPVFHGDMVIGVHTGPRIRGGSIDQHQNRGVLLTPDKNDWIVSMSGGAVSWGQSTWGRRALTVTSQSTQTEQSDEVRRRVARSVALAETGARYDLVHDDSARVNVGIGSWTGTRIADLLDAYESFAAARGLTAQLHGHLGGSGAFDELRARFRTQGAAATASAAERAGLRALGADAALQGAQDSRLAEDVRSDLAAIGSTGDPWYPFIDGGTGAISELAAHVLVHARHQAGGAGLGQVLRRAIDHFGGDTSLGTAMVAGTVTEHQFLEQVADGVVARVQPQYQDGVRRRYERLFADHSGSDLSYWFNPAS